VKFWHSWKHAVIHKIRAFIVCRLRLNSVGFYCRLERENWSWIWLRAVHIVLWRATRLISCVCLFMGFIVGLFLDCLFRSMPPLNRSRDSSGRKWWAWFISCQNFNCVGCFRLVRYFPSIYNNAVFFNSLKTFELSIQRILKRRMNNLFDMLRFIFFNSLFNVCIMNRIVFCSCSDGSPWFCILWWKIVVICSVVFVYYSGASFCWFI